MRGEKYDNLVNTLHVSRRTIARDIDLLRSQNRLMREGGDYDNVHNTEITIVSHNDDDYISLTDMARSQCYT